MHNNGLRIVVLCEMLGIKKISKMYRLPISLKNQKNISALPLALMAENSSAGSGTGTT